MSDYAWTLPDGRQIEPTDWWAEQAVDVRAPLEPYAAGFSEAEFAYLIGTVSIADKMAFTSGEIARALAAGVPAAYLCTAPDFYYSYSTYDVDAVEFTLKLWRAGVPGGYASEVFSENYMSAEDIIALHRAHVPTTYLEACTVTGASAADIALAFKSGLPAEYAAALLRKAANDSV